MAASNTHAQDLLNAYRPSVGSGTAQSAGNYNRLWELDQRAWVQRESLGDGTTWRIVGDQVVLDAAHWPSLARPDGGLLSGRTVLLVEARELVVDMALRFDDGGIVINARSVKFGPRGSVSFAPPKAEYAQQFQLTAQTLSLEGARRVPLAFTLDPERRTLSFKIETLKDQEGVRISEAEQAYAAIRRSSLSRRVTSLSNNNQGMPIVSPMGDQFYYHEEMGETYWPQASVLKLQRFFARAPYDDEMRNFILAKLNDLESAFATLRGGVAEMSATTLVRAVENRTDISGLIATDVPMTPLDTRIERFDSLINGLYGENGELALWDAIAVAASTSGAIDVKAFTDILTRIKELDREMTTLDKRAGELNLHLAGIEDEISLLHQEMSTQEQYIKQQIIAETYKNPNDGVPTGIAILATVGSIAFPVAAPYLAVASGIVSAQYALDVNEGDELSKIADVVGVIENHAIIVENARLLRSQWGEARNNFGAAKMYVTDRDAMTEADKKKFATFKSSLEGMKKSAKTLYEVLAANKPTAEIIFEEERIRNDPRMIEIVQQRNAAIGRQTQSMEALAEALASYEETSNELLLQTALISELQALDLTNDREKMRLLQLADVVRRDAVTALAREAVLLRRAVRYFTGQNVDLPADVLLFPEGNSSEQQTFVVTEAAQIAEELRAGRVEEEAHYRALLRRATETRNAANDGEGWNVEVPIPFTAHSTSNTGSSENQRVKMLFIAGLNRLIADAIRSGGRSGSIPIPIDASPLTTTAERAVVAGINVSSLTFKEGREPDAQFIIVVEHPRIGTLYRRGVAEIYTDASAGASADASELSRWRVSLPNTVAPDWKSNFTQGKILGNLNDFVGPFFTAYTLSVEVTTPQDWTSAPEIESIEMEFIVAKPT